MAHVRDIRAFHVDPQYIFGYLVTLHPPKLRRDNKNGISNFVSSPYGLVALFPNELNGVWENAVCHSQCAKKSSPGWVPQRFGVDYFQLQIPRDSKGFAITVKVCSRGRIFQA